MDCLQWLVFSYLHLALIFCKHVNAGFQRRTFARTINFQLATIWKIPRDLCHILWRLFTIARQFPKYFSRQFVVIGKTSLSLAAERIWSGLTDKAFIAFNHGKLYSYIDWYGRDGGQVLLTWWVNSTDQDWQTKLSLHSTMGNSILTLVGMAEMVVRFSWPGDARARPSCHRILTWALPGDTGILLTGPGLEQLLMDRLAIIPSRLCSTVPAFLCCSTNFLNLKSQRCFSCGALKMRPTSLLVGLVFVFVFVFSL